MKKAHQSTKNCPDEIKLVKVFFPPPTPTSKPPWSLMVAQAISNLGGMANITEISQWIMVA